MNETNNIFINIFKKIEKGSIEISDAERTKAVQSIFNFLLRGYEEFYGIDLNNEEKRNQTKKLLDDLEEQVNTFIDKRVLPIATIKTLISVRKSFYDVSKSVEPNANNEDIDNPNYMAKQTIKEFSDDIISRIDDTLKHKKRSKFDDALNVLINTTIDFNNSKRKTNTMLIVDVLKDYLEDFYSSTEDNRQDKETQLKEAIDKFGKCIDLILNNRDINVPKTTLIAFEDAYNYLIQNNIPEENSFKESAKKATIDIVSSAMVRIKQSITTREENYVKTSYNRWSINEVNAQQTNNDMLRRPMGVPETAWSMWTDKEKINYDTKVQNPGVQIPMQQDNLPEMSLTTKKESNKFLQALINLGRKVKKSFERKTTKNQTPLIQNNTQMQSSQQPQMNLRTPVPEPDGTQWYEVKPAQEPEEIHWHEVKPAQEPEMPMFTQAKSARAPIMPELYPEMQQHNTNPVINDWHPQEQFRKSLFIPPEELGVDPSSPNNTWHKINGKTYIKKAEGMVEVLGKDLE